MCSASNVDHNVRAAKLTEKSILKVDHPDALGVFVRSQIERGHTQRLCHSAFCSVLYVPKNILVPCTVEYQTLHSSNNRTACSRINTEENKKIEYDCMYLWMSNASSFVRFFLSLFLSLSLFRFFFFFLLLPCIQFFPSLLFAAVIPFFFFRIPNLFKKKCMCYDTRRISFISNSSVRQHTATHVFDCLLVYYPYNTCGVLDTVPVHTYTIGPHHQYNHQHGIDR